MTDALIRKCLNEEGVKGSEKGFYVKMGHSPFPEFGFQRSTSVAKVEGALGRLPTDEEIEDAKRNPHSVDYVFCPSCEKKFGVIENNFLQDVYPLILKSHLNDAPVIELDDIDTCRVFFLLQVWRWLFVRLNSKLTR